MAQQAWRQHLCSTRTQLQSLARRSGFGIWRCRSCVIGHRHGSSDLIPGPGMPYASGRPKKKKRVAFRVQKFEIRLARRRAGKEVF